MSIFGRMFGGLPRRVDDPVLGALTRAENGWSGKATWPHDENPFALSLYRKDEVPQPSDRRVYEQLSRDYRSICPDVQRSLLGLWNDYRSRAGAPAPEFANAIVLWESLQLQGLGLHQDGHVELIYGFRSDGQPEGAFVIGVHGRNVEPIEYVE